MIKRQSFYERHEGLILGGGALLTVLVPMRPPTLEHVVDERALGATLAA